MLHLSDDLLRKFSASSPAAERFVVLRAYARHGMLCVIAAGYLPAYAWLAVNARTVVDALMRAPPHERILIRSGTIINGQVLIPRPLHVKAEDDVYVRGQLLLRSTGPNVSDKPGVIENLSIKHFMESAVLVEGSDAWPAKRNRGPLWGDAQLSYL